MILRFSESNHGLSVEIIVQIQSPNDKQPALALAHLGEGDKDDPQILEAAIQEARTQVQRSVQQVSLAIEASLAKAAYHSYKRDLMPVKRGRGK